MIRTKVTQPLALAGFTPAGKLGYANGQDRFSHAANNQQESLSRSTRSPQRSSLLWLACAVAAMGIAPAQAQTYPKGAYPDAGVIRDSAGNLYGTTVGGGTGFGVVYKVDTSGHEKVLHSFTGGTDGASPFAGVIRDSAGNLYGTTFEGGTIVICPPDIFSPGGCGVVYKVDTAGQETVLYAFTGGADGTGPGTGVIRDSSGNLYGTAGGGAGNAGVVYKLDTAGQYTVLYSFTGGADGSGPSAVIRDWAGNLYGTTFQGGIPGGCQQYGGLGCGVVFKLDAAGQYTVLYAFTGGADGGLAGGGVIPDPAGNLYGTTGIGGDMSCGISGCGVVFKLDTAGQETALYSFTGGADGGFPNAVIRDPAGNLYGTTYEGGTAGQGVVFKLDAAGQETVLYTFTGLADGCAPLAGVIRDPAGKLYGTASACGAAGLGVVYKLDPHAQAPWPETVLYTFPAAQQ